MSQDDTLQEHYRSIVDDLTNALNSNDETAFHSAFDRLRSQLNVEFNPELFLQGFHGCQDSRINVSALLSIEHLNCQFAFTEGDVVFRVLLIRLQDRLHCVGNAIDPVVVRRCAALIGNTHGNPLDVFARAVDRADRWWRCRLQRHSSLSCRDRRTEPA